MVVEGGATLQDHWETGEALKAIHQGSWDYVILQDQSRLGAYLVNGQAHVADPEFFHKYARHFHQQIKKSGARTIFYLTWASQDAQKRDQAALNYAYMAIARELNDLIAPVGIVWQKVRRENPKLELYIEDKSHPQSAGSYLAACVIYTTIYGQSPVGLPAQIQGNPVNDEGHVDTKRNVTLVNLSSADARLIQRAAWETYQKMKASNGYLSALKPPPPDLPALPAGRKPTTKDLEGLWIGTLRFYPVPWSTKMELNLQRQNNGEWKAELAIKFEGHHDSDKAPEITNVKVTETGISFLDAKGVSGAPMKYRASLNRNALSGIVEAKAKDKPITAVGTWEVKRQD